MSTVADLAPAIDALPEAIRAAASDPADQIRLLLDLARNGVPGDDAIACYCRLTVYASIANAAADYQPASYDEAVATLNTICAAIDAECDVCADREAFASYEGLRAIRAAIVSDLSARALSLPRLVTVTVPRSLPVLVIAYSMYGDASRADDLLAWADPPHPAWMPTTFQALDA